MEYIHKILVITRCDRYNNHTLELKIKYLHEKCILSLSLVKTNNIYNIYYIDCNLPYKYLQFSGPCDLFGSINDDDINYNHCRDLWNDELTLEKEFELTASVYSMYRHAITIYVLQQGG